MILELQTSSNVMDETVTLISNALKTLKFNTQNVDKSIEKGDERSLSRQACTVSELLEKVYISKDKVIELKVVAGEADDKIEKWCEEINEQSVVYEVLLERIKAKINEMQLATNERFLQEDIAAENRRRRESFGASAHHYTPANNGYGGDEPGALPQVMKWKLPKLQIASFNGTHMDWPRFWNQFQAEVDRAPIAAVTKFSYLRGFIVPNVRALIDGLPWDDVGYTKAKEILSEKYGQESEVVNSHIQEIMNLPTIVNVNPAQIHAFYRKLIVHVQSLETMDKLASVEGYVRNVLDRLPKIRSDLVRLDKRWKEWDFLDLVQALREWTERNPVPDSEIKEPNSKQRSFKTNETSICVYCEKKHVSSKCNKVKEISERRIFLSTKKLCFNCTGGGHQARTCPSRNGCAICSRRHHTSICDKPADTGAGDNGEGETGATGAAGAAGAAGEGGAAEPLMCAPNGGAVTHPLVVVRVNGVKCRALMDSGSGTCYASAKLIELAKSKPVEFHNKNIEMLLSSVTKEVEIHDLKITSTVSNFEINRKVTKVDKDVLLKLPNPRYKELVDHYPHLKGVSVVDKDTKDELPIHMVLGTGVGSDIKMKVLPRIGKMGEPTAELTHFGWIIQSPGHEVDTKSFLTHTSVDDFDQLCRLDVLGLEDRPERDQETVFREFKEQLEYKPDEMYYETDLMWKAGHRPLRNNKEVSLARLSTLLNRLKKNPAMFEKYDEKISAQIAEGIVEVAPEICTKKEFNIPYKAVVEPDAESTDLRIVHDCSSKPDANSPSINECLDPGPSLYNMIRDILIRNRMLPIALTGDMKQAFLQIRVREHERDALRFHWIENRETMKRVVLRFTRPLFGLIQSPFILAATVQVHLERSKEEFPKTVTEVEDNIYVDDVVDGGFDVEEVQTFKDELIEIFKRAGWQLHKWHSNVPALDASVDPKRKVHSSLLGVYWNKELDEIGITIPKTADEGTKREILAFLAKLYDVMGLISPVILKGKLIFRELCELKIGWDKEVPPELRTRWIKWKSKLPDIVTVPRSITLHREPIMTIDIHCFGDASKEGCCAAVYVVVHQESGSNQGLLVSNARLSKRNLTIPRLELVAAHMVANSLENVREALSRYQVTKVVGWSDSTTALHWIRGRGKYKQFVSNRVKKILSKRDIVWRHVPGKENPSDVGSRGCDGDQLDELWWKGPEWLSSCEQWPEDIVTKETEETKAEAVLMREIFAVAVTKNSELMDQLIEKFQYWKV